MFQMISDNAGLFRDPTLSLSTVALPRRACIGYVYESCLFADGVSDVVGCYKTIDEAVVGHAHLPQRYNLHNSVK